MKANTQNEDPEVNKIIQALETKCCLMFSMSFDGDGGGMVKADGAFGMAGIITAIVKSLKEKYGEDFTERDIVNYLLLVHLVRVAKTTSSIEKLSKLKEYFGDDFNFNM